MSRAAAALCAAIALVPAVSVAYVPPSQFVVKKLADKRVGYKTIRVKTQVTGLSGDIPNGVTFRTSTVFDFASRTLRSRAWDESGQELYVAERKLGGVNTTVIDSILFDSSGDELAKALKSAGVPIRTEDELLALETEEERRKSEVASLERLKTSIAWVFGKKIQLWIEKDTFLPLKFVTGSQEIRFEGYRYVQEFAYPKALTLAVGSPGSEVAEMRDEFVELVINQDLQEMKSTVTPGYTDAGNSASSDVRSLISRYYQTIR